MKNLTLHFTKHGREIPSPFISSVTADKFWFIGRDQRKIFSAWKNLIPFFFRRTRGEAKERRLWRPQENLSNVTAFGFGKGIFWRLMCAWRNCLEIVLKVFMCCLRFQSFFRLNYRLREHIKRNPFEVKLIKTGNMRKWKITLATTEIKILIYCAP